MTDQQHLEWDATAQSVVHAWHQVADLHNTMEDMPTAAASNRLVMALQALEDAMDYIAAARARMPKQDTERSGTSASDV